MNTDSSMSRGPSRNLIWEELACKDGTAYPKKFILDGRVFTLANVFESIRSMWGKPILIHSAYRTPTHNKRVGGAPNSQHVQGRALDLAPPKGVKIDDFYYAIKRNVDDFGIHGIGRYPTFVHVDIRPSTRLVTWNADGIKDSRT
jgi:uncharacterized protein YcbK (DUF882 family)